MDDMMLWIFIFFAMLFILAPMMSFIATIVCLIMGHLKTALFFVFLTLLLVKS